LSSWYAFQKKKSGQSKQQPKSRVTRLVCENIAQKVAQPIICQNYYITLTVGKNSPKI
jgi:hypothetical protein